MAPLIRCFRLLISAADGSGLVLRINLFRRLQHTRCMGQHVVMVSQPSAAGPHNTLILLIYQLCLLALPMPIVLSYNQRKRHGRKLRSAIRAQYGRHSFCASHLTAASSCASRKPQVSHQVKVRRFSNSSLVVKGDSSAHAELSQKNTQTRYLYGTYSNAIWDWESSFLSA